MANPEAIMRAAQAGGKPMGGMPEGMEGPEAAHGGAAPEGTDGGLDGMMNNLESVGAFLKAQATQGNPAAAKAMATFQTLLTDLSALGGGAGPKAPVGPGAPPASPEPATSGRIPMDKIPGTQVL